jgi:hypothetical protein
MLTYASSRSQASTASLRRARMRASDATMVQIGRALGIRKRVLAAHANGLYAYIKAQAAGGGGGAETVTEAESSAAGNRGYRERSARWACVYIYYTNIRIYSRLMLVHTVYVSVCIANTGSKVRGGRLTLIY